MSESESARKSPLPRIIGAVVIIGLAAWFVIANTQEVSVRLWVAKVEMPMWIMLVVVFAAGWAVGALLRRRSAKKKAD
ncbi:LapA family protein [Salininema proteolyticum]|uniref:LapA family protein n=1 Tax=Salininema proteolyticum TaxID=1607685 RepID=A0ABV8TZQ8_9ACTN